MKYYFNFLFSLVMANILCVGVIEANYKAYDGYVHVEFIAKAKPIVGKMSFAGVGYLTLCKLERPVLPVAILREMNAKDIEASKYLNRNSAVITFIGTELLLHQYGDKVAPIRHITELIGSDLIKGAGVKMPEGCEYIPKVVAKEVTYLGISLLAAYCVPMFLDAVSAGSQ